MPTKERHIALTIAGSDSGGGAGIQADLKTFAALGVHGTSAITCLTAQNPKGVIGIQAATPAMVEKQLVSLFSELPPRAAKSGMLYSEPIIEVVAAFWKKANKPPLIVDPVMVATSGAILLQKSAINRLRKDLLPQATLLTPNLDEAALLLRGRAMGSVEDLRRATRALHGEFGCAILLKGGHLRSGNEAVDIFFDGKTELLLSAPFVRGINTHGTGCTYSAAITAAVARGTSLPKAVALAKQFVSQAIADSYRIGKHMALSIGV